MNDDNSNSITLNHNQETAKQNIHDFIISADKYYVLMGAAGTGKTSLITQIFNDDRYKGKSIAFAATTNKAVAVLKILSPLKGKNVTYTTIHKLLNIRRRINYNGQAEYKAESEILGFIKKNYDIIIVDEASMVSRDMIEQMDRVMRGRKNKIIYVGDINQLPPINENRSSIFTRNYPYSLLTIIERYKNDIVKYATSIIKPKTHKIKYADLGTEVEFNKDSSIWINTYCENVETSIMLAYTNRRVNYLNKIIRHQLFNTTEKYVINDKIVFNSPYTEIDYRIHTSEIGIIKYIDKDMGVLPEIVLDQLMNLKLKIKIKNNSPMDMAPIADKDKDKDICPICFDDDIDIMRQTKCGHRFCSGCIKLWLDKHDTCPYCRCDLNNNIINIKECSELSTLLNDIVSYTTNLHININYITIEKNGICRTVVIIDPQDEPKYKEIIEFIETTLQKYKKLVFKMKDDDAFIKILLTRIWEFFYLNYIDKFANIDYGYCITIHKSQGSTYENVFVDLKDIVSNNSTDTKECVYTAITRASDTLNILR